MRARSATKAVAERCLCRRRLNAGQCKICLRWTWYAESPGSTGNCDGVHEGAETWCRWLSEVRGRGQHVANRIKWTRVQAQWGKACEAAFLSLVQYFAVPLNSLWGEENHHTLQKSLITLQNLEDKDLNTKSYGRLQDAITQDITWNSAQPARSPKEINKSKVNPTPPLCSSRRRQIIPRDWVIRVLLYRSISTVYKSSSKRSWFVFSSLPIGTDKQS